MKVCLNCGESWDKDTFGYSDCLIGSHCIACIHEILIPLDDKERAEYSRIRELVKIRIARVNQLLKEIGK